MRQRTENRKLRDENMMTLIGVRNQMDRIKGITLSTFSRQAELILTTSEIDQGVAEGCRQVAGILLEFLATQEQAVENTNEDEPSREYVYLPKEALQGLIEGLQRSADSLDASIRRQSSHSAILEAAVAEASDYTAN